MQNISKTSKIEYLLQDLNNSHCFSERILNSILYITVPKGNYGLTIRTLKNMIDAVHDTSCNNKLRENYDSLKFHFYYNLLIVCLDLDKEIFYAVPIGIYFTDYVTNFVNIEYDFLFNKKQEPEYELEIKKINKKLEEIENMIKYAPGGIEYENVKSDFNDCIEKIM